MAFLTSILEKTWLLQLGAFFFFVVIVNIFLRRLFERFKRRRRLSEGDWRVQFDHSVLAPIRALLWVTFVSFLLNLISQRFELSDVLPDPVRLRNAGIVFCVTWFLFRWKRLIEDAIRARRVPSKKALDPTSIDFIGKIYSVVVVFISSLIFMQIFGLDVAPLIAFGGIGAAALGFASKDAIANFYGGLTIYMTRPFIVNDFVELPQRTLCGTIESIGWYFTTLRDLSKKPVYVPNSLFATELLVNFSRMTHRRIDESLSLRYADAGKIESLIEKIRQHLYSHPKIDQGQSIWVFVSTFAESAIILEIKAYTLSTRYEEFMEIKQKVMIRICELVFSEGIGIGYPIRETVQRNPKTYEGVALERAVKGL
jgi:MscS family membrane protein